jgi:hypothetical protein
MPRTRLVLDDQVGNDGLLALGTTGRAHAGTRAFVF